MSREGVYVCAELGCNWQGNKVSLLSMADEAIRVCHADAVKLQMFNEEVIKDYEPKLKEELKTMVLDTPDVLDVAEVVHKREGELVVTPMYMEAARMLKDISEHIDGVKIRAKDWMDDKLVSAARAVGKPLYISVPRVGQPIDVTKLARTRGSKIYRIYCIDKYPPKPEELNLNQVKFDDGCSLHSPYMFDHYTAAVINTLYQYELGSKRRFYVEVHFMSKKYLKNPDSEVSLDLGGLSRLCGACARLEETIG